MGEAAGAAGDDDPIPTEMPNIRHLPSIGAK
jgi:hypothetical protein